MKGDLHNIDALDRIKKRATASFCDAAPKLLGVEFRDMDDASCEAASCDCDADEECHCEDDHPLHDLYDESDDAIPDYNSSPSSSAGPSFNDGEATSTDNSNFELASNGQTPRMSADNSTIDNTDNASGSGDGASGSGDSGAGGDKRSVPTAVATGGADTCGGDLIPIREAQSLLDDDEWCKQARYSDALRLAYEEWRDRTDDGDDDLLDQDGNAVQRR
jgi:hypothetical protein